jgi:hypothetical protein
MESEFDHVSKDGKDSKKPVHQREDPKTRVEFQQHIVGCLRAIVKLIQAPKFSFDCSSPWDLCRQLQRLIGEPDNSAELADLAYFWRTAKYWPSYFTNSSYRNPFVWGIYLDQLPLNVILPEDIRVVLNRVYNQLVDNKRPKSTLWEREQSCYRTYRLLHPLFKKDFLTRVVWKKPSFGSKPSYEFNLDELEMLGWCSDSHPSWLLVHFWKADHKIASLEEYYERVHRLCPERPWVEIIKTWVEKRAPAQIYFGWEICKQMSESFGVWPLINSKHSAIVFHLAELELWNTTYFSFNLGLPVTVAQIIARDLARKHRKKRFKRCFIGH